MKIPNPFREFWSHEPIWFGDEESAALIDLRSGREIGHYMHDGYGKWHLWVCLPYWRAWSIARNQPAGFTALAAFPRCWIWLFRAKSQEAAVRAIEHFAGRATEDRDARDEEGGAADCMSD